MIRARESNLKVTLEKMELGSKPQYNVFEDYLGLINLICPTDSASSSPTPSPCGSVYDFPTDASSMHRHRMNSLDSESLSDSSSSGDSREADFLTLEPSDMFVYPSPSPPPKISPPPPMQQKNAILETPPFSAVHAFETLMAQKAVLSRLQPLANAIANNSNINNNNNRSNNNNNNNKNANKATVCVFCRNNGESREFYSSHTLKDNEGNTSCPILRAYTCPLCKANGDNSHTVKYCPKYTPKLKVDKLLNIGLHQL